jgi:tetratricopeptide (TPR) repeat protein
MLGKIKFQMLDMKRVVFSLFCLFIPYFFLESSIINPDLVSDHPGYEDFIKGRSCFQEENWVEAISFFSQAIEKSHKPFLKCTYYLDEDGYDTPCGDFKEDIRGYAIQNVTHEITFTIYRHSHFYLGLISLYQEEFAKANLYFQCAIELYEGSEEELEEQFYKCANIIEPFWIALASLTRLHSGNVEEAKQLMDMAVLEWENFEYALDWQMWKNIKPQYWKDLRERGITTQKWDDTQFSILSNAESVIAQAQNNLKQAIRSSSSAIFSATKTETFLRESRDHFVLYNNRALLYLKNGNYQEALLDFTKAIELNPVDAEIYFQRAGLYLFLEEYSKAFEDYQQAITINPNNPEYYLHRALAYTIIGSIDEAKLDLESAKITENKLNHLQNELGLSEFSKGSFQKAINHFSKFISLNPHSAIGYQNRGMAFYQAGKLNEAISDYNEAIRLNPFNVDLYQMRALVWMTLPASDNNEEVAHLVEAKSDLLKALEINPMSTMAYQNLATCCSIEGDLDGAISYYERALTLTPQQDHSRLFKNLSFLYFEHAEYAKALLNCEKAIQSGYKEGNIYLIQGLSLFETNELEKAIQSYDLAIQAGYEDANVYFSRAKAYFCLQHFDKALKDATRALKANPSNTEYYKLRGLIFLSMHKELEAYSDFHMAINVNTSDSLISENQDYASNSKLKLNAEGNLFQFKDFLISLDGLSIYKSLLESISGLNEKSILTNINQIDLNSFGKGLAFGLMDGGVEMLKELGPFFANLLFHPIETTKELLTAIDYLLLKSLEGEWDTIFETLAPELKELFSNWDKIEDYHKGKLTGIFIGKNGVAALTAIGAAKTLSKLKNVVIDGNKKALRLLRRMKPEVAPLPASELPLPLLPQNNGWHLPYQGGVVIGGGLDTEHALLRIAPDNIQNRAILEARAIKKTEELGLPFMTWKEVEEWTLTEKAKPFSIDPRGVPPSVIEAEIANPGSTVGGKIQVILNEEEDVVAVLHVARTNKILVQNRNKQIHIMQPKHAWDKLIKLTGNIEEDCKNVVKLLEDHQIFLEKYRVKSRNIENFIRYDHKMQINGYEVNAIFNHNIETGQIFLNDAWVITK